MGVVLSRMLSDVEAKKVYGFLKREDKILEVAKRLEISVDEVYGLVELLNYFDLPVNIIETGNDILVKKGRKTIPNVHRKVKPHMEECTKITVGVVSDTHLCSKDQQLHMLNSAYRYFYENDISLVLHIGDLVDGDYGEKRKAQIYGRFMNGADEQSAYVIEMYPNVEGITTKYIQGSHDETHNLNGGVTLGKMISQTRKDMTFLGQDHADILVGQVKTRLRHPGGGVSKYRSRSVQHTIDAMSTGKKVRLLIEGHYHKQASGIYRNVNWVLAPCLCAQSQFMERKDISNTMGFYVLDIYYDEKGDIQYITPKEHLFGEDEVRKDDWRKTKRLVIKH